MVVLNDSDAALDVSGWTVRDSSLTTYTLPARTVIGPRDHIRIFTGSGAPGTPTPRDFHFGGPSQMFANWDPAAGYFYGDGAYVYDAQPGYAYGNLRAWFEYPCDPAACGDRLVGTVVIGAVQYNPPGADTAAGEYVEFRNTTPAPVGLGGYAFGRRGSQYPFPPATMIPAGGTLRLSMGVGADTADTLFLGRTASLLTNSGDHLTLEQPRPRPGRLPRVGGIQLHRDARQRCADDAGDGACRGRAPGLGRPTGRPHRPQCAPRAKSTRVTVRWAAPAPNGTTKVTKYRARVYLSARNVR